MLIFLGKYTANVLLAIDWLAWRICIKAKLLDKKSLKALFIWQIEADAFFFSGYIFEDDLHKIEVKISMWGKTSN